MMKTNRTVRRPPARPPGANRERPTTSVFSNFVRALEKLESARAAARPAREGGR
jgi:hypothetical protein